MKDHFLYLCTPCNFYTPYCFSCNKSIEILLNSNFFKCFFCKKLAVVSHRETYYSQLQFNPNSETLNRLFQNRDDARLLKINLGGSNIIDSTRLNTGGVIGSQNISYSNFNSNLFPNQIQGGGFTNLINQNSNLNNSNFQININNGRKVQSIPGVRVINEINDLSSVNYYTKSEKKSKRTLEMEELEKQYTFLNEKPEEKGKFKWMDGIDPKMFLNNNNNSKNFHSNSLNFVNSTNLNNNNPISIPINGSINRNFNNPIVSNGNNLISLNLNNSSNFSKSYNPENEQPINIRQLRGGLMSVRHDHINRPLLDNSNKHGHPDYSVLQSKRDFIRPATSVKKKFSNLHEKENLANKRTSSSVVKSSVFAGYNKNESTLRPKSPITPRFSGGNNGSSGGNRNRNSDGDSLSRLNNSEMLGVGDMNLSSINNNSHIGGNYYGTNPLNNSISVSHFKI